MSEIKAVVWDVDGVLMHECDGTARMYDETVEDKLGAELERLKKTLWDGRFEPCLVGKADTASVLANMLEEGGFGVTPHWLMGHWLCSYEEVDRQNLNVIDSTEGVLHVLGTNQDKYRAKHIWDDLEFKNSFDEMFASGLVGYRKPQQEFFGKIQEWLGERIENLHPANVLFFDDMMINVTSAQQFGWQVEHYVNKDGRDLAQILKGYGITLGNNSSGE